MRLLLLSLLLITLFSCETQGLDSDKRQIIAKDLIRSKIPRTRSFKIVDFREDTVRNWSDSNIKKPISYTLNFLYKDSTGTEVNKEGVVVFAPSGTAVLSSIIKDK